APERTGLGDPLEEHPSTSASAIHRKTGATGERTPVPERSAEAETDAAAPRELGRAHDALRSKRLAAVSAGLRRLVRARRRRRRTGFGPFPAAHPAQTLTQSARFSRARLDDEI